MTNADVTTHWAARLADLAAATGVPGAAFGLWARGQSCTVAHGVLSTATDVPVTPDSVFQIGSITKPWTGTMIMQLIDEGRLSLGTTVAEVLPGSRICASDIGAQVTVRHLLNHTSGIDGDLFTDTGRGDDCIERYVAELADAAVSHPAGSAYSYCNSGFVLLGRIIEVLDGRVWDESLRKRLVEPLGLTRTVTLAEEAILHRAAVGHRGWPRVDEAVSTWGLARAVGPAGLITASVGDVLTFALTHLNDGLTPDGTRVLSAASALAMKQPTVQLPGIGAAAGEVGLSWRMNDWGGRTVYGHDGSTVGQNAFLRIDPQARIIACLLTNAADGRALYQRLFGEVFEDLAGITMPADPVPASGPVEADLSRHVGRYERSSRRIDLTLVAGRLHAVEATTGDLAKLRDPEPEELDLHPTDTSGDNFVLRTHDEEPWSTLSFSAFDDGSPYLFAGGRITPKVS